MNGGEIIDSGGFGCVFKPALKCKGKMRETKKITKLMTKRHTLSEYKEIEKYKKMLKKVPHYEKYYLLNNIKICVPDKLTEKDLTNYGSKCSALQKDSFSKTDINKNRNKLMALNMPDGGKNLGDYLDTIKYKDMHHLNNLLIDLLLNGIIPMNKLGVYHSDVKDSNILFKTHPILIDWGLSTEHKKSNKIPNAWKGRPFQYNVPFSSILFNSTFDKMYSDFLLKNKSPSQPSIRVFVVDYVYAWSNERGPGHFNAFNRIFRNLFSDDLKHILSESIREDIIKFDFTFNSIVEYLTHILVTYTKSGKINLIDYLNDVYAPIIDIWGFIMSYNPILEKLFYNYRNLNNNEMELFTQLKHIFVKYLFTPRVEPIKIDELVENLRGLNKLFDKCAGYNSSNSFTGVTSNINSEVYETSIADIDNKKNNTNARTKTKTIKSVSSSYRKSKTRKLYNKDKNVTLYE